MKKIFLTIILSLSALALFAKEPVAEHHRRAPQRHEHVYVNLPYSSEEIDDIVDVVKKLSFDSDRKATLKLLVRMRPITVDGLEKIAKMFSFDKERTEFLVYAYDYCVDKESFYKLKNVYTFSSEADNLFKKLGI
ncbi:MAG: DUF4476 domain-containing protein [Paludibacteraceae bacterium]|nr:DUF4476 domain-containing protein [Paludibacteraceae bacterium]